MSSQAENNLDSPVPETVILRQGTVQFRDIQIDPAMNSYRDAEEFSDAAIALLAEHMLAHGLITPWLVHELPEGKYMGQDCNRRYHAVSYNIRRRAAGFTLDMEIPVQILPATASELAVVKRAVASNIQRSPLSDIGKIRAAVRLKALGATDVEIGQTLAVSTTTVARLLTLGTNPVWMKYVSDRDITFSTAVRLLQVAEAQKRLHDLTAAFDDWRAETRVAVEAEDHRRRANDETSLTISQKYLQTYLKGEQVDTWMDQLRSGRPLGPPAFRYKAHIRAGDGPRRLEIEAISRDLDGLSLEDLAKITGRIADLNVDLKKALLEKHAASRQSQADGDGGEETRPSERLLRELGLWQDGEGTEEAEEAKLAEEAEKRRKFRREQLACRGASAEPESEGAAAEPSPAAVPPEPAPATSAPAATT